MGMKQKFELADFIESLPVGRSKKDVFKGKYFNIVIVCLESGQEIPPHDEPYDVFFCVISGRGIFTAGEEQWDAEPGSMILAPAGSRGIKCIERLTILSVQEPH